MRAPEFSASLHAARQYPELWRLLLGLLIVAFCYIGFAAIVIVIAYPVVGPLNYFGWLSGLQFPTTPGAVLTLLLTFTGMLFGPVLAAAACHFRGPGSLFGPAGDFFRAFGLTALVLIPVYGAVFGLAWAVEPPLPNLDPVQWLRLMPLAIPLLMVQITAEELLFRGYLQQQLAVRFAARWVWMGLPALLFASLHYDPTHGAAIWPMLAAILIFALIAADLTERTGNLGAAMALHFVNNFAAMMVVSVKDTITGLSLFMTPYAPGEGGVLGAGLDLAMLAVIWLVLRRTVAR